MGAPRTLCVHYRIRQSRYDELTRLCDLPIKRPLPYRDVEAVWGLLEQYSPSTLFVLDENKECIWREGQPEEELKALRKQIIPASSWLYIGYSRLRRSYKFLLIITNDERMNESLSQSAAKASE